MPAAKHTKHATGAKGTKVVDQPSRYYSPLRERQAAATRRAIIDAALVVFGEQGWTAPALPMVAARAGTSVDTIYATFGTKSALLMTVVDVAIVGDDEEAPMAQRPDFAQFGEGRRHERLRTGVRYTMDVYARSVPILDALREAGASDPAAEERLARYGQDRRDLIATGMALILGEPPSEDLLDDIWSIVA